MQLAFDLSPGYRETPEEVFLRVYRQLRIQSRRAPAGEGSVRLRWRPYAASIGTVRIRGGEIQVGLSELLRDAPGEVLEALAIILLSKIFRRPAPAETSARYRAWLHDPATRARIEAQRAANGRKQTGPSAGACYDLEEIFHAINTRYFGGAIARPVLAWSRRASRTHLGHWDPAHSAIVLSRFLDQPSVPRLAVEYVMFHEMLHVVHPPEFTGGVRRVHHRAFKDAERRVEGLKEAKAALKRLCAGALSF